MDRRQKYSKEFELDAISLVIDQRYTARDTDTDYREWFYWINIIN